MKALALVLFGVSVGLFLDFLLVPPRPARPSVSAVVYDRGPARWALPILASEPAPDGTTILRVQPPTVAANDCVGVR